MKKIRFITMFMFAVMMIGACSRTEGSGAGTTDDQKKMLRTYFDGETAVDGENSKEDSYPDYFAGGYRKEDGEIVVCLTDNRKMIQVEVQEILEGESLQFEKADYSLNDLKDTSEYIRETHDKLYGQYVTNVSDTSSSEYELLTSINGWGIDGENNHVVISVRDLTDEKKETFKKLFPDAKGVDFEEGYTITGM